MIYDTPITVCSLPEGAGSLLGGALVPRLRLWCAEETVYSRRFWESVQAGSSVDQQVALPLRRDIDCTDFVLLRGRIFKVNQVQLTRDEDGLPLTVLGLHRVEQNYEILFSEASR